MNAPLQGVGLGLRLQAWLLGLGTLMATGLAAAEPIVIEGRAMGTTWRVTAMADGAASKDDIARRTARRLEELEQIFSTYREASELARFNAQSTTDWVPVSRELAELASRARQLSALTDGAFDVTIYPLVQLWGFGGQRRTSGVPTAVEIVAAKRRVDWRQLDVRIEPAALRKGRADVSADFSSLAKGFAADELSTLLAAHGWTRHLVQVGGDMRAREAPDGATAWTVGIERPDEQGSSVETAVQLGGSGERPNVAQALSTSGDYRNFFRMGGRRYGHIIDPRTGEPVSHALAAVSVLHPSCAWSSALATALFVLGPDEGFPLAEKEGLACLFVIRDGDRLITRGTRTFPGTRRP